MLSERLGQGNLETDPVLPTVRSSALKVLALRSKSMKDS